MTTATNNSINNPTNIHQNSCKTSRPFPTISAYVHKTSSSNLSSEKKKSPQLAVETLPNSLWLNTDREFRAPQTHWLNFWELVGKTYNTPDLRFPGSLFRQHPAPRDGTAYANENNQERMMIRSKHLFNVRLSSVWDKTEGPGICRYCPTRSSLWYSRSSDTDGVY